MTGPFLGGLEITGVAWLDPATLMVSFSTTYTGMLHQVYMGRTLCGTTSDVGDTIVFATISYIRNDWQEEITLLAVDPSARDTDFGADLPPRPYNRVQLSYDTTGLAADTAFVEITGGDAAGGAVDLNNVLTKTPVDVLGPHVYVTDPLQGSGTWNFQIAGRDGTLPDGNRGTALATSATIDAHPPDWTLQSDGSRFSVSVAAGVLTVGVTYP